MKGVKFLHHILAECLDMKIMVMSKKSLHDKAQTSTTSLIVLTERQSEQSWQSTRCSQPSQSLRAHQTTMDAQNDTVSRLASGCACKAVLSASLSVFSCVQKQYKAARTEAHHVRLQFCKKHLCHSQAMSAKCSKYEHYMAWVPRVLAPIQRSSMTATGKMAISDVTQMWCSSPLQALKDLAISLDSMRVYLTTLWFYAWPL